MNLNEQKVHNVIEAFVNEKLAQQGRPTSTLDPNCDLIVDGVIDSMGFVELTAYLENELGDAANPHEMDADEMTIVGPLTKFISNQLAA
ncbi:MAG: hypothetical protein AAF585_19280 [Verrucomicrobiota bacterium]